MSQEQLTKDTILIVEDDAAIGTVLLELVISELHYTVVLVNDSLAALDAVTTIKPVLMILNYHLPHMTGLQLYDQLHATKDLEHVPAIMLSANLPQSELTKRGIVGIDKPFDVDALLSTIETLLNSYAR